MPRISPTLAQALPITSKLNPLQPRNWEYLLASATATRFAIAALRSEENYPTRIKNNDLSPTEKKKTFAERMFMEFFGTAFYLAVLHVGQDIAAKGLERWQKNLLTDTLRKSKQEIVLNPQLKLDPEKFENAFKETLGTDMKGMLSRILYGSFKNGENVRANRANLCKKLNITDPQKMYKALPREMTSFALHINTYSGLAIVAGIIASATLGGIAVQWFNDNVLNKFLNRIYHESTPTGFSTLPMQSQFGQQNPFAKPSGGNL